MKRPSNYLCGKPANRNYSNGDRLQARYDEIHGDHPTFMARNSSRLIVLCIVGLGAIGAASWGMAVVNDIALDRIEMGVE